MLGPTCIKFRRSPGPPNMVDYDASINFLTFMSFKVISKLLSLNVFMTEIEKILFVVGSDL